MYNNQTETLTADKFQTIYTDEKFRNNVAFAHGVCDSNMKHLGRQTCTYPVRYWVTPEQIAEAEQERQRAKAERIASIGNKLVFVGMGMTYEPRYEGDVCNHRIRTEFANVDGHRFFIELGTGKGDQMRCDHSVDRTLQDKLEDSHHFQSRFYNYKGLEHNTELPRYTKADILELINSKFDCKFTELEIDNYNLRTEDFICQSPK